jgi:polysaccharide pyruvyl transferase WcaK-like protein
MSNTQSRRQTRSARSAVFAWATGQDDNIGDSLLRRPYLAWLRDRGELNVWVRDASDEFVSGLQLQREDRVSASFWRWIGGASLSALQRRTYVALNAGEMSVSKRGAAKMVVLAPVLLLCRLRGGGGVWVGSGVPPHRSPILARTYMLAARLCDDLSWRDKVSASQMRIGSVSPDWAFTLGTQPAMWTRAEQRDLLTIVLRGDRAFPGDDWWKWVLDLAQRHELDPTVVVQVRRDGAYATRAASEYGVNVVSWPESADHREQEETVRRAYKRSAVTIGDRLHGLIVAATEGSIPLGWVPTSRGKIARHFEAAGIVFAGQFEGDEAAVYPQIDERMLQEYADSLISAAARAKSAHVDRGVLAASTFPS